MSSSSSSTTLLRGVGARARLGATGARCCETIPIRTTRATRRVLLLGGGGGRNGRGARVFRARGAASDSGGESSAPTDGVVYGKDFVMVPGAADGAGKEKDDLPWVEKLLTLWIVLACALGTGLSQSVAVRNALAATSVGATNIPIACGLILMMYPPLAKVHYDWIPKLLVQARPMTLSIVQNWILGPLLMFFLAFAFLRDHPEYLQGVILVGCARCIAMVIVWNEFADGDSELCATLVALNSILTVVLYAPFAYGLINKLLPALGVETAGISLGFAAVLKSVGIYLGIPFVAGAVTWVTLRRIKGEDWYYDKFAKQISPITLIALLFTIVIMFALEGHSIIQRPTEILLCCVPMLIYFSIMFVSSFFMAYFLECEYSHCATIAFTAASNNFELALAVAVSVFGFGSPGAFATIAGPLVEIPVMLALVHVSKSLYRGLFKNGPFRWSKGGASSESGGERIWTEKQLGSS